VDLKNGKDAGASHVAMCCGAEFCQIYEFPKRKGGGARNAYNATDAYKVPIENYRQSCVYGWYLVKAKNPRAEI